MKKRYLLLPLVCGLIYITSTSELPGTKLGSTTIANCATSGCHTGGTSTTTINSFTLLDQTTSTVATGSYTPGHVYTVAFVGSNSINLPKYGFQLLASKGAFSSAGSGELITGRMLTHGSAGIAAISNLYTATANWTAPAVGSGTVTFQGIFNAVNGNGNNAGDNPGTAQTFTYTEGSSGVGVGTVSIGTISVYPNPANSNLNIRINEATTGIYNILVYNTLGKVVATENFTANQTNTNVSLNTGNLAAGSYFIEISKDGGSMIQRFVKQ